MKFKDLVDKILIESSLKRLEYHFKCTDADNDGIFEDTPFGTIDTDEFSQFISSIEKREISLDFFKNNFILPEDDENLKKEEDDRYTLNFYFDGKWVVIFDGDTHYVYSI